MKKNIYFLLLVFVLPGCGNNASAPEAKPESAPTTSSVPKEETPVPDETSDEIESAETTGSQSERIKLAKGASDTDLKITLDAGETKAYVAFVQKGFMTCIMPDTDLGTKVTVTVNGKVRDLAEDGPCSDHATKSGDQTIAFTNNGNKEIPFMANLSFNEHM
ncbi:MAG: hypothetical protein JNN12_07345 [Bacteroidetes Order II. Incertae sedis bacterium]|nr:hypothetical protein [Bacteroidetes Order II. bacterium]